MMNRLKLNLAGLVMDLRHRHPYTRQACRDYITEDGTAQLSAEAEAALSDGYEEFISLYRQIAEQLPRYRRAVVHGAAVTYAGNGILFMAPSGTGKSTHIRLWKQVFGAQVDIINGDKPSISLAGSEVVIHGTPWAGKEGWQKNRCAPLKAICLLRRGEVNRIRRADAQAQLPALIQQIYLPADPAALQQTLALVEGLIKEVPLYILECNISPDAASVACEGMREAIL